MKKPDTHNYFLRKYNRENENIFYIPYNDGAQWIDDNLNYLKENGFLITFYDLLRQIKVVNVYGIFYEKINTLSVYQFARDISDELKALVNDINKSTLPDAQKTELLKLINEL